MATTFTSCPFCRAGITSYWPDVHVWRCRRCDLLFRNPMPTDAELAELYTNSWEEPDENRAETGGTDVPLARVYARHLAASLRRRDFRGLRILEFGAGRGPMLTAMAELGAEVYGVEPFGFEHIRDNGFQAFERLDQLPEGITFDGIVSIDVVEHLAAPWEELKQLRGLLKPGGWIYVATLNTNGLNARITRSKWREVVKAGHLTFFNPGNMEKILRRSGFGTCRRLRWRIHHSDNTLRQVALYTMQTLALDGELRYLAWR